MLSIIEGKYNFNPGADLIGELSKTEIAIQKRSKQP